jgi:H+/Cl- antiporter ClcA
MCCKMGAKNHISTENYGIIILSFFVGIASALVVVAYRVVLQYADVYRTSIYELLKQGNILFISGWFILLIIGALLCGYMIKKAPMTKGSGIPQVKGVLAGYFTFSWLKEIIIKFTAGVISIGFGLSLGREGPSVQLGAETGFGISHIFKRTEADEKYLITCGAAAGLTAAFNAPLAGIMFALPSMVGTMGTLVTAFVVAGLCYGGYLGIFPSMCADAFGVRNLTVNYGVLFSAFAIAGVAGPIMGGKIAQGPGGYPQAFMIAGIIAAVGFVLSIIARAAQPRAEKSA